jgi:hypothetical protein
VSRAGRSLRARDAEPTADLEARSCGASDRGGDLGSANLDAPRPTVARGPCVADGAAIGRASAGARRAAVAELSGVARNARVVALALGFFGVRAADGEAASEHNREQEAEQPHPSKWAFDDKRDTHVVV